MRPDFFKPVIEAVKGTVVECNTAYEGSRNTTEKHLKTLEAHGWSQYFHVDLLDAEGPDMELPVIGGKRIRKIMLAAIWQIMIRCLFCHILKAILWAATAVR